jgi:hypothetical protein
MKKFLNVIIIALALNFLAVAGGVGWLYKDGRLDNAKAHAIKDILYPPPATQPTTQPVEEATTQPTMRLEELLARASGRTASEQVEFIRTAFDAQAAMIERRRQEVYDRQLLVDHAQAQLIKDRAALDADTKTLKAREQQATKLASDKGFQDSLILYNSMPSAQVKKVFAGLDDQTIMNYLQAMEPRTASKIIKEFKSPEETERIQKILERMRLAQASTKE